MNRCDRFLLVAVPIALILLGLTIYKYGFLRVVAEMNTVAESEAMKTATLEKYVRLIAEKPELEKKIAALQEVRKAEGTKLVEGKTPALAAAALQNIVKQKIMSSGGTVLSERAERPEELGVGNLKTISVSFEATEPDSGALTKMLYATETSTPFLIVRELECRIMDWREPKQLSVRLKISALTSGK